MTISSGGLLNVHSELSKPGDTLSVFEHFSNIISQTSLIDVISIATGPSDRSCHCLIAPNSGEQYSDLCR
jgi:hypothetical protein